MHKAVLFLLLLILAAGDADRLDVVSEPAVASIAPVENGRRLIRLPELEFPMRIAPYCGGGGELQSVSISVADTRQNFTSADYADRGNLETIVKVSPKQLAPVAVESFCIVGEPPSAPLLLERTLTAQVSLQCAREGDTSIVFEAQALDVRLLCEVPEAAEAD